MVTAMRRLRPLHPAADSHAGSRRRLPAAIHQRRSADHARRPGNSRQTWSRASASTRMCAPPHSSTGRRDGKGLYISTQFGDVSQVHRVRKAGGSRQQLTWFAEPVGQVRRRNGSDELAITMDQGGGERDQIFLFDPRSATDPEIERRPVPQPLAVLEPRRAATGLPVYAPQRAQQRFVDHGPGPAGQCRTSARSAARVLVRSGGFQ